MIVHLENWGKVELDSTATYPHSVLPLKAFIENDPRILDRDPKDEATAYAPYNPYSLSWKLP